jgi:dolichol-phosphate mannosyltransferase
MDLSVVIPVYNEVENIRDLVEETSRTLQGTIDYEIIVVDDGSDDDTPTVLQACRAVQPRLRVIRHAQRSGQSAAIGNGVQAARSLWIVTLDGDGQNDPADIMRLYSTMESSADKVMLVTGQRLNRRDDILKRFSSRVANAVRAWVLQDRTPDTGCGIKLFARDTYNRLPQFDHMHRFLPALVQGLGGETVSIAVNHRARRGGVSKYGVMDRLWTGIIDMLGVWWLLRRSMSSAIAETEQS